MSTMSVASQVRSKNTSLHKRKQADLAPETDCYCNPPLKSNWKVEQRQVYFILMFIILLVSAIAFFRYRVTEHGYCVSLYSNLPVRKYTICLLQNSIIATISI